jgi:hypothetical protein
MSPAVSSSISRVASRRCHLSGSSSNMYVIGCTSTPLPPSCGCRVEGAEGDEGGDSVRFEVGTPTGHARISKLVGCEYGARACTHAGLCLSGERVAVCGRGAGCLC